MLKIESLKVKKDDKKILQGVNLELDRAKTYILMGPNGSGKSSLAKTISGDQTYEVTEGTILLQTQKEEVNLLPLKPEERSLKGIFVSYQHPPEIAGLNVHHYLRAIYNKRNRHTITSAEFTELLNEKLDLLHLPREFSLRYLNEGFSGGEKKKMEVLQMLLLRPRVAILDEIDSGVDIDALKTITSVIKSAQEKENLTVLFITHYPSLLDQVNPFKIFLMKEGKIVKEGREELMKEVSQEGYAKI